MNDKYNEIINQIKELEQQIYEVNKQLEEALEKSKAQAEEDGLIHNSYKENEDLYEELYKLCRKLKKAVIELSWCIPPIKSNGVIELRKSPNRELESSDPRGIYHICLCGQKTIVGEIEYRGYHVSETLGDIGYIVNIEYQGHNYSYQALCLLGELLKEKGIEDFIITVNDYNIPSKKVIEKYGSIPIKKEKNILVYVAKTFINEKQIDESPKL